MEKEAKSGILLSLLLISILALAFNIQTVRAIGTIYIRSDGSIDPPTAPIQRDGDMYVLTDNITSSADNGIVIQRNNMTLDGADYTLQGSGGHLSIGIFLSGRSNVTIRNMEIMAFDTSIYLDWSSNNNISGNTVTGEWRIIRIYDSSNNIISGNYINGSGLGTRSGIHVFMDSSNNIISENTVTSCIEGISLEGGINNSVLRNTITNNYDGILVDSSNNTIAENNIVNSVYDAIMLWPSSGSLNNIYHNNFINNTYQVTVLSYGENFFDDGYPSGGNYWSDYTDVDLFSGPGQNESGSDGIWDNPYTIDEDNEDRYPLVEPYSVLHDVAVTGVTIFDYVPITATYNGTVNMTYIDATVENQGNVDETFNVSIYYELAGQDELLTLETVTLSNGSSTTVEASFNISHLYSNQGNITHPNYYVPTGYLTIVVEASEVANETDTSDNTFITQLLIKLTGDVNGDGCVDSYDFGDFAWSFGTWFDHMPRFNDQCDFNRDGLIDATDFGDFAFWYGKCTVYPVL